MRSVDSDGPYRYIFDNDNIIDQKEHILEFFFKKKCIPNIVGIILYIFWIDF